MLIVFTTTPDKQSAETLAHRLVSEKLAGCVQILPQITSVYFWEGEVQKDEEYLLLIKTMEEKFTELEAFITANHSYDVPEIVALSAENVTEKYDLWLKQSVS